MGLNTAVCTVKRFNTGDIVMAHKIIGCTVHGKYQKCESCSLQDSPQQCIEFKRKFNAIVNEMVL